MKRDRSKLYVVLRFRKFVCVPVALMILASPLLACALPGVQMSEEEMACCRQMADQCGDSSMTDSHSCCKKPAFAQADKLQIKQRDVSALEMSGQIVVATQVHLQRVPAMSIKKSVFDSPESPPGHTSVLRI